MNNNLLKVALRSHALYLNVDRNQIAEHHYEPSLSVMAFVKRLKENGFSVSEELLHALSMVSVSELVEITKLIDEVMGVNLNWASLVKGWEIPTGEVNMDHFITFISNVFKDDLDINGTTLPCGHLIPEGTFPLERYNGCPFCGMPFRTANYVYKGQGSKLKDLRLYNDDDMHALFLSLLSSPTPLNATQLDSLNLLLNEYDVPTGINIPMKETAIVVVQKMVENGRELEASVYLKTPTDILRFLWYRKTGNFQIIEPHTLIKNTGLMYHDWSEAYDREGEEKRQKKQELRLKYNRKMCRTVATWLNNLPMSAKAAAEDMHPKRGMWVRFIHALRLGEYARKQGYDNLRVLLDVFYKEDYTTWMGQLNKKTEENDVDAVLAQLRQRPGLFARSLFATMLRFGCQKTLSSFEDIVSKLPLRLVMSLGDAAEQYFARKAFRIVLPITGYAKQIKPNKMLSLYSDEELKAMVDAVRQVYLSALRIHFAEQSVDEEHNKVYIDPMLYDIPISVGDRDSTIQDISGALQGTRFPVEGDSVRLFLQWGKGLKAQHLDMDLSCRIAFPSGKTTDCAFNNLVTVGAKHSGDIRRIPDMVGTAEYIELSMPELIEAGAKYVTFICNAYSYGPLSPNLVVGWMNSAYPMKVSEKDGVAYDPSCVQHMVRIGDGNLLKGLVFGVLDIEAREIIWLEMPFTGQTVRSCNFKAVEALLKRLEEKTTIGEVLDVKVKSQNLIQVENLEDADIAYTYEWALNPSDVCNLLFS